MMQELSNVYDESESEKVYKQILSKMFATMADRSSVNKLFNQQLSEHKQEVLDSDVDMHFLFRNVHFVLGLSNGGKILDLQQAISKSFSPILTNSPEAR